MHQTCYVCPVSVDPREKMQMSESIFDSILGQLAAHRSTIEGGFLQSYNAPTVERRFVQRCHKLLDEKFAVPVLTIASGLAPKRVDLGMALRIAQRSSTLVVNPQE